MSRPVVSDLETIATAAGLPVDVGVSGARGELNDRMLKLGIAGYNAKEIVAELAGTKVTDGYRTRVVEEGDAVLVLDFLRRAKQRLYGWDREARDTQDRADRLRALLEGA